MFLSGLLTPAALIFATGMLIIILIFNLYSRQIFEYLSMMKNPFNGKSQDSAKDIYSFLSVAAERVSKLESRLMSENSEHLFNELALLMRATTARVLGVPSSFTLEYLEKHIRAINLDPRARAEMLIFHRDLLLLREIHLTKRDVSVLMLRSKRLLRIFSILMRVTR
ncbi:MAG: hypothetical protein UY77_C0035G0002 [Candidatus Uhrbacteria bacterium GW2011_GWA2_53_10]|uniref:Uncharacterized protein n=1 Tax=Candidatus Uhrbacteria bacterium GW2011_GWA2_53_10 TaxID=1618980 RepID=A0A0G1ZUW7_9BACT|nr:MAG: hypothetical protein UY77_C0035G0002 [Candidatus Uhrbacteria bacterium GW2011_GWA2_53_10]